MRAQLITSVNIEEVEVLNGQQACEYHLSRGPVYPVQGTNDLIGLRNESVEVKFAPIIETRTFFNGMTEPECRYTAITEDVEKAIGFPIQALIDAKEIAESKSAYDNCLLKRIKNAGFFTRLKWLFTGVIA